MSEFNLIFSRPNFELERIDPSTRLPYRWRAKNFPALIIESCTEKPSSLGFSTELKIVYGKRDDIKYPSKLRISLRSLVPTDQCDSIIDWTIDSGKFAAYHKPSKYCSALPGTNYGWLIMAILA